MTINDLFREAMKRELPELLPRGARVVNLGAGHQVIDGAEALDYPEWNAETDDLPYEDASIDSILAYHFFEHLTGKQAIALLREVERVLKLGGTLTLCVPYYNSSMASQDLDHQSFWNEGTFKTLFGNPHYIKNREVPWQLEVHFQAIMGVVERNLCLLVQLVRSTDAGARL